MKIIEAMKKIKDLQGKVEDLRTKVGANCANMSFEKPTYENPRETVQGWIQSQHDILEEILKLRVGIHRTNIATRVPIMLGDVTVTKTIAEWIHRRRDLAKLEQQSWSALTDRGLKDGFLPNSQGGQPQKVEIVRHFDPALRDRMIELFRTEPSVIDATLETVNAVTDIIN